MKFTITHCIERSTQHEYWGVHAQMYRQHQVSEKEMWQMYHNVDKHVYHQFLPIVSKIKQELLK